MPDLKQHTIFSIVTKLDKKSISFILLILIILPIFNILIHTIFAYETDRSLNIEATRIEEELNSSRYDLITATITETYKQAKIKTDFVKKNIIEDLDKEYNGDYNRMKEDYLSRDKNSPFYLILSKNITGEYINIDSSRNRMFIANRRGILIDNSLDHFKDSFTDWETLIATDSYEQLLKQSLTNLTNQEDNLILWIDEELDNSTCSPIIEKDKPVSEFIHSQIINNNILSLNKFSFLVASYIFDHEDIFGIPDVVSGQFTNNDKIYVVQIINIYDIIRTNQDLMRSLNKYEISIQAHQQLKSVYIKYRTVFTIAIVLMQIITFFGIWYLVENYIYYNRKLRKE